MRQAYRLVIHLMGFNLLLMSIATTTHAQSRSRYVTKIFAISNLLTRPFRSDHDSASRPRVRPTSKKRDEINSLLYFAITDRIGTPYRASGTDDRGFDCSGFVWKVFNEAGIEFKRSSAKSLWKSLPEASEEERSDFGTLVFFKDLGHVGIIRDAESFYHVSSSKGVEVASLSGYWGKRITGYRTVPLLPTDSETEPEN